MVSAIAGPRVCSLVGWRKQDWNLHLGRGLALLARQYFRGQLETPGSPLASHSFNLASLLGRQVCCSMKIDGLLLADFWTLLNNGGNKTHSAMERIHRGFRPRCHSLQHKLRNLCWYKNEPYAKSLKITLSVISVFRGSSLDHVTCRCSLNSFYFPLILQLQTPKN